MAVDNFARMMGAVSLVIAGFALLWNIFWSIYKELLLKPCVKVSFVSFFELPLDGNYSIPRTRVLSIRIVNHGPGDLYLRGVFLDEGSRVDRFLHRAERYALLLKVPPKVSFREAAEIRFPWNFSVSPATVVVAAGSLVRSKVQRHTSEPSRFLRNDRVRVGVEDAFGRMHWCRHGEFLSAFLKEKADSKPGESQS